MLLAALATASLALAACSSENEDPEPPRSTVHVATGTTCDRDLGSDEAQTINERVGGLRTEDFVVHFSQTTRLGNVALVTGDVTAAFGVLTQEYGVSVVAELEDDTPGRVTEFAQVRALVDDICGAD